jgi:hypothetical protein
MGAIDCRKRVAHDRRRGYAERGYCPCFLPFQFFDHTVYPRCPTPLEATKRVVGVAVMMLSARLILTPIPLSNILPALLIALIALAYAEEDGLVLSISLLAGFVVIAIDLATVWEIVHGAKRIRLSI